MLAELYQLNVVQFAKAAGEFQGNNGKISLLKSLPLKMMNYMSVKLPCHSHGYLVGEGRGLHCEDTISCLLLCSAWILVDPLKRPLGGLSIARCSLSQTLNLLLPIL